MMHAQFLRIKKLTGKTIIQKAARHNHREILAEMGAAQDSHIDPARTGANRVLRGCDTAAGVVSAAQSLMDDAGVKPLRKDAVRALEIIFSLPPQSAINHDQFFNESVQWAEQYFAVPVILCRVRYSSTANFSSNRAAGRRYSGRRKAAEAPRRRAARRHHPRRLHPAT